MAYHLHKAKEALAQAETELAEASRDQGSGDLDSLTKAREAMRAVDADLARALQALNTSGSAPPAPPSTVDGSTILTPGTSVAGDASRGGPQTTVPPAPGKENSRIPLAVRKELRDNYVSKEEEWSKKFSDLLRVPWTVHVDSGNVFGYLSSDEAEHPGQLFASLMNGALENIETFFKDSPDDGADGRDAINRAAYHHVVTIEPYAPDDYAGCDFHEGKLRLLFKAERGIWGPNGVCQYIGDALHKAESTTLSGGSAAGAGGQDDLQSLPFLTRYGIKREYEPEMAGLKERAKQHLGKDIEFVPNFAANFASLKAFEAADKYKDTPLEQDWQKDFGRSTFRYFEGFVETLESNRFERDDMLQEGFHDAVPSARVEVRVVDKKDLKDKDAVNELIIENGSCVLRAHHQHWGLWQRDVARELMNQL